MPGGAVLPKPLASNPFDGQWAVEGLNECTDCQIFNRDLTDRSENPDPAKEAMMMGSSFGTTALLDIDARIGKLTTPLAATLPAKPAEISRKRLRDESGIRNSKKLTVYRVKK
jgi:hypothetical protein